MSHLVKNVQMLVDDLNAQFCRREQQIVMREWCKATGASLSTAYRIAKTHKVVWKQSLRDELLERIYYTHRLFSNQLGYFPPELFEDGRKVAELIAQFGYKLYAIYNRRCR